VNKTVTDFGGIYIDIPPPPPPLLRLCELNLLISTKEMQFVMTVDGLFNSLTKRVDLGVLKLLTGSLFTLADNSV